MHRFSVFLSPLGNKNKFDFCDSSGELISNNPRLPTETEKLINLIHEKGRKKSGKKIFFRSRGAPNLWESREKNVKIIGKNWKCHGTWSVCERFSFFLRPSTFNGRNIGTINFMNSRQVCRFYQSLEWYFKNPRIFHGKMFKRIFISNVKK